MNENTFMREMVKFSYDVQFVEPDVLKLHEELMTIMDSYYTQQMRLVEINRKLLGTKK